MMKNRIFTIIFATICIATAKPAKSDLIFDPALMSGVVGGMGQTINENIELAIQQYNTFEKIRTQGFGLDSLALVAGSPLGQLAKGYFLNLAKKSLEAKVKDTKSKNTDAMKAEAELDVAARKAENEEKLKIEKQQLAKEQAALTEKKQQLPELENNFIQREKEYNDFVAQDNHDFQKYTYILSLYVDAKNKYEEAKRNIEDLEKSIETTKATIKLLEEEGAKIGTNEDQKWMDNQRRIEETESLGDDVGLLTAPEDNAEKYVDWGKMEDLEKFSIDETTYKNFIKAYFLDPEEIANASASQQHNQSLGDKVLRQRKYLIINTMTHLLQVTASVRREIPVREAYAKSTYDKTIEGEDELNAIVQYSNTRIEQSRALLLYAKLQAAKLQYQAARQIDKVCGLYKQGDITENSYKEFDLGKYILTKEYLDKIKEASNGEKNQKMQSIEVKPVQ